MFLKSLKIFKKCHNNPCIVDPSHKHNHQKQVFVRSKASKKKYKKFLIFFK